MDILKNISVTKTHLKLKAKGRSSFINKSSGYFFPLRKIRKVVVVLLGNKTWHSRVFSYREVVLKL